MFGQGVIVKTMTHMSNPQFWSAALCLAASSVCVSAGAQPPVTIRVDRSTPIGISRFEPGVTHTQHDLDSARADPQAAARVKKLLPAICRYQVEPIMGWGADNPEPSPGVYNWESLDRRMRLIESMRAIPVITLCAAPDWMKGGEAGKTNWSRIEAAPVPEHFGDFAVLAKKVAQRYPKVRYFQVWNEFKGFWDAPNNNWNYIQYTDLYNQIYDALKSVSPAIKVGGPYLVVEGTGMNPDKWYGAQPITKRNMRVIDYWLAHKHGADFLVLDRSITDSNHDPGRHTEAEAMAQTRLFGEIVRQLRAKTDLPIWWAEYYGDGGHNDPDFVAAEFASIYAHMATASAERPSQAVGRRSSRASAEPRPRAAVEPTARAAAPITNPPRTPEIAFLWGFLQEEGSGYHLFTKLDNAAGGQPTAHYRVLKLFHDAFPPGTQLYRASSSSPDVEVLASRNRTLLINKRPAATTVEIDGKIFSLAHYEVRLLDSDPQRTR